MAVLLQRRLFTVDEYFTTLHAGVLTEDGRVELLEGEIVTMPAIGSRHAGCVKTLVRPFATHLGQLVLLGVHDPVHLTDRSEPQPDVSLLVPRQDSYGSAHPAPADVYPLVEVSDTTAEVDRAVKLPLYARAGIREVWLVDLVAQRIEVCRDPSPVGYGSVRRAARGQALSPLASPILPCRSTTSSARSTTRDIEIAPVRATPRTRGKALLQSEVNRPARSLVPLRKTGSPSKKSPSPRHRPPQSRPR